MTSKWATGWGLSTWQTGLKWESLFNPRRYCSSFHSWNQKNSHITFLFNLKHLSSLRLNNSLGPILPCFQWAMYPIWRDKTSAVGDRDYLQFEAMGLGLRWALQSGPPHDSCWPRVFSVFCSKDMLEKQWQMATLESGEDLRPAFWYAGCKIAGLRLERFRRCWMRSGDWDFTRGDGPHTVKAIAVFSSHTRIFPIDGYRFRL